MANPTGMTWPAADFTRVPYGVFTDPGVFELEQQRIFRGPTWIMIGLDAEVPEPGDFKTSYIGDTPVVISRAEDGTLYSFVNRCAHRGTTLVRHPRGNAKGKGYTCVYHHWSYDLEGRLVGVPFLHGSGGKGGMPEDFAMEDHRLRMLHTEVYSGVIFASFEPAAEELADYLDEPARRYLDRLFRKPIEILGYMRQSIPGNWKLYLENLKDPYHAGLLHQLPMVFGLWSGTVEGGSVMDKEKRHEIHYGYFGSEDAAETEESYKDVFESDLALEDRGVVSYREEAGDNIGATFLSLFPCSVFQQFSNSLATRQVRPRGPGEFELYWTLFGYADDDPELRRMRMVQSNLVGPGGYVSMEDGESGALIQRAIRHEQDAHSVIEMGGRGPIEDSDSVNTEVAVRGFWRHYCHLMGMGPESRAAE